MGRSKRKNRHPSVETSSRLFFSKEWDRRLEIVAVALVIPLLVVLGWDLLSILRRLPHLDAEDIYHIVTIVLPTGLIAWLAYPLIRKRIGRMRRKRK